MKKNTCGRLSDDILEVLGEFGRYVNGSDK